MYKKETNLFKKPRKNTSFKFFKRKNIQKFNIANLAIQKT